MRVCHMPNAVGKEYPHSGLLYIMILYCTRVMVNSTRHCVKISAIQLSHYDLCCYFMCIVKLH